MFAAILLRDLARDFGIEFESLRQRARTRNYREQILLARCVDVFVEDQLMFRFVSFKSKVKPPTLWRCLL